jgi:putative serine protease PepD
MKRPFVLLLLAAFAGAAAASAVVLFAGVSPRGSTAAVRTTTVVSTPSRTSGTRQTVASTALTATQIYQRDSSGVVSIKAVTADGEDSGTGIVLNEQGLILTNDHVIAGATSLTVNAGGSTSTTRPATVVGEEANSDLALVRVNPSGLGLKPLKLVNSSSLQVGNSVYAIGNPYGLEETLTRGIVSALDREISAPDGVKITGAIQTDAALNPGNSGGPLLNEQGDVVGVNSQIASDAADVAGSQPGSTGVGFAISSNTVAQVVKEIEAGHGVPYASAVQERESSEGRSGSQGRQAEVEGQSEESLFGSRVRRAQAEAEAQSEGQGESSAEGQAQGREGPVVIVP